MKKHQEHEESGEKAPLWIISFADMISLLMAFFVMLQTMAAEKTNNFLETGKDKIKVISGEFRRNIDNFGIPTLFGKPTICSSFHTIENKSSLENPEEKIDHQAVDGHEEKIRRLFSKLSSEAETHISQFDKQKLSFEATPITFTGENTDLDNKSKSYLMQLASTLQQAGNLDNTLIYVAGLAPDMTSPELQWTVSELRARKVKSVLQSLLPGKDPDSIHWWGAGPDMEGLKSSNSSNTVPTILIASEVESIR